MILEFQSRLAETVRAAARAAFDVTLEAVAFQYPPRIELGDLALTAPFDLAKVLKRKPREIAERLASELAHSPAVRRAEALGLANRVVAAERLMEEARALAARLAAGPPRALGFTKRLLRQAAQADLDAHLALGEAIQPVLLWTEDHKEAVRAFGEKRPPRFSGR